MKRTLTEILKDADKANELQVLIDLWNEIANNKYNFSLVQIWYANEHIRNLALKVKCEDLDKGKFYTNLKNMHKC